MHAVFARASLLSFSQRRAPCRPQTADKRPQRAVRADRPLSPPERAPAGAPATPGCALRSALLPRIRQRWMEFFSSFKGSGWAALQKQ